MYPYQLLIQSRNPFPKPTSDSILWNTVTFQSLRKIIRSFQRVTQITRSSSTFLHFCFAFAFAVASCPCIGGGAGKGGEIVNCTEGTRPTAPWTVSFKYTFVSILQIYTNIRKKDGYKVRKMSKGQSVNFLYHPIFQRTFGIDALFS